MSILLAYKKEDRVYMASDTAVVTSEDAVLNETSEEKLKICRTPDGILVGVTGDRIVRQEIFTVLDCFVPDQNGNLSKEHIVRMIIPKLYDWLSERGLIERSDDSPPCMKACILLAYQDVLFEISGTFAVCRYDTWQVCGSAFDFAAYALAHLDETADIPGQLLSILRLVSRYCMDVLAPFITVNTKDLKVRLWEK